MRARPANTVVEAHIVMPFIVEVWLACQQMPPTFLGDGVGRFSGRRD